MSSDFATFQLWEALSIAQPAFANSTNKFQNDAQIKLDYCVALDWTKKRTDITGVQNDQGVHPDTGPAGAFVQLQFTVDRSTAVSQDFLSVLIKMYGRQNTNSAFKRGFIGLINTDNPQLDVTIPTEFLGYRIISFGEIDPIDFHARQIYRVLLQLGGKAINLPNLT